MPAGFSIASSILQDRAGGETGGPNAGKSIKSIKSIIFLRELNWCSWEMGKLEYPWIVKMG